jgi:hypothetical protein
MRTLKGSEATGAESSELLPKLRVYEMADRNGNPMQREDSVESRNGKTKSGEE